MGKPDENAVAVAERVDQSLKPDMAALFGSEPEGTTARTRILT